MTTTISPGLGHNAFTQQGVGATPGYDAIDFRRLGTAGLQEGVMDVHSFEVTQRGAGANMSVDIAASTGDAQGSGVAALVQGDAASFQGLYPIPPHTAVINETLTAAHASLPRVDRVILEVFDNIHDSSGSNLARTRVLTGTATSGANLNNLTGAAAVPSSAILLADIQIGVSQTTTPNSLIRDRRKWARGGSCQIVRTAGDYSVSSTTYALLDSTNLTVRLECSGVLVRMAVSCTVHFNSSDSICYFSPQIDGTGFDGAPDVGAATFPFGQMNNPVGVGGNGEMKTFEYFTTPAAGSHVFSLAAARANNNVTVRAGTTAPLFFLVEEFVRQNTRNNATTTG